MSSETKYLNSNYEDFFEKSLSKSDPDLFKCIEAFINTKFEGGRHKKRVKKI